MAFRLQNDFESQAEAAAINQQRQLEQQARLQALLQQAVSSGAVAGTQATGGATQFQNPFQGSLPPEAQQALTQSMGAVQPVLGGMGA